jgi:hypothetical protein
MLHEVDLAHPAEAKGSQNPESGEDLSISQRHAGMVPRDLRSGDAE